MLGILCGLASEAQLLPNNNKICVAVSAANPQRARWEARDLIKRGATKLLSFGLCGALEPDLPAGALIIGTSVQSSDGAWAADEPWCDSLRRMIPAAHCGAVWGSETIIATPTAKAQLYARTRCLAADMESQAVAQIAAEAKVPFAVLRAVIDTADMTVPPAATLPLTADGVPQLGAILLSLIKNPAQLPHLLQIGRNNSRALAALAGTANQLA